MSLREKTLSVFVDESGSFDSSCEPSRFYLVTCVFHDQSFSLAEQLARLDEQMAYQKSPKTCFHAGPLIRREDEYRAQDLVSRRRIFGHFGGYRKMLSFGWTCLVYHATTLFCRRNYSYKNDALGKTGSSEF